VELPTGSLFGEVLAYAEVVGRGGSVPNSPWMENPMRQKRNQEKDQNEDK